MKMTIDDVIVKTVQHLLSLPDGTEISTVEAIHASCGFVFESDGKYLIADNSLGFKDMFELDLKIRKAARKAALVIDDSLCAEMEIGLPFNTPYLVKKKCNLNP